MLLRGVAIDGSHLYDVATACGFNFISRIERVRYSIGLEFLYLRRINILDVSFVIWYICDSILFELFRFGSLDVILLE